MLQLSCLPLCVWYLSSLQPLPLGLDGGYFKVKWQTRRITTTSQVTPLLLFLAPWLMPSSLQQSKKSSWSSNLVSRGANSSRWDDLEWGLPGWSLLWVRNCNWNWGLGQKSFFVCLGHKLGVGGVHFCYLFCFWVLSSPCMKRDQLTGGSVVTDASRDSKAVKLFLLKIT